MPGLSVRRLGVAAQRREHPVKIGQGLPARVLHRLQQLTCLGRVLFQGHPRGPGLDDEQVDGVSHHVV